MTHTCEPNFQIGSIVAYSRRFLQSIGVYTGEMPAGRGRIIDFTGNTNTTLAVIDWGVHADDLPQRVNIRNLVLVTKEQGVIDAP